MYSTVLSLTVWSAGTPKYDNKKKTTVLKLPLILPSSSKPFQFRKRKEVWFFCPPLQAGCSAIPLAVSSKSHPLGDPLGQHPVCRDESRHNSILSGSSSASALLVLLLQVCVSWRTKTRKYISCAAGSFCSSVSSWQDRTGNVHFLGCTQCEVEEVFRDAFFFLFENLMLIWPEQMVIVYSIQLHHLRYINCWAIDFFSLHQNRMQTMSSVSLDCTLKWKLFSL